MGSLLYMAADGTAGEESAVAWLPWLLVGAGCVLLATVAWLALKARAGRHEGAPSSAKAEVAELQARLVEVKRVAATVADDLDRRAERLERLLAEADEVLDRRAASRAPAEHRREVAPQPVDDLTQRVLAMVDRGHTPVQIAQSLRQPIGNIELMIALRGNGAAGDR